MRAKGQLFILVYPLKRNQNNFVRNLFKCYYIVKVIIYKKVNNNLWQTPLEISNLTGQHKSNINKPMTNQISNGAKKILLVEDEVTLLEFLSKKLSQEGYKVTVAEDGEDALKKMREDKPDLILLDIIMPKKDGFDVLEEMNKKKEFKKIPVIIVSNSGQPVELERAKKLGIKDWLIKTEFDPQEVISKVKKQIG